jgi:hypothetical protein
MSSGKQAGSTITPPYRSAACLSVFGASSDMSVCVSTEPLVAVASCAACGMSDERARGRGGHGHAGGAAAKRARAPLVATVGPRAVARRGDTAERADTSLRYPIDALEGRKGNADARRRTGGWAREMILDANAAVVAQAIAHFRDIAEWRSRGAVPRTRPKERRASSRATPAAKSCDHKCVFEDCVSIRVFSRKKHSLTSLNSWRVRKQLSRRVSDHIEERCAARSFRDSSKLRHGGQCIRPLHGVHHAAVPGRRRVTARAPDRGCVSRREKQSVSPRPVRRPRGARVTRAAKPRRFTRFRRVLRACGFLRSADRPPRYRPPPQIFARSRTRPKAPRSATA